MRPTAGGGTDGGPKNLGFSPKPPTRRGLRLPRQRPAPRGHPWGAGRSTEQPSGSACPLLPGWQQEPSCGRLSPRAAAWARAPCHVPGREPEEREGPWETAPSPAGAREHPVTFPAIPGWSSPDPGGVLGEEARAQLSLEVPEPPEDCQAPAPGPYPARSLVGADGKRGGVAWPWPPLRCVCHDRSQLRPLHSPIKRRAPRPEPLLGTPAPEEPGCSARAGTDARTQSVLLLLLGGREVASAHPRSGGARSGWTPSPGQGRPKSPWSAVLAIPAQPCTRGSGRGATAEGRSLCTCERAGPEIPDKRHRAQQTGKGGGGEAVTVSWRTAAMGKGLCKPLPISLCSGASPARQRGPSARDPRPPSPGGGTWGAAAPAAGGSRLEDPAVSTTRVPHSHIPPGSLEATAPELVAPGWLRAQAAG